MSTPSQEVLSWACAFGRKRAAEEASALRAEQVLSKWYREQAEREAMRTQSPHSTLMERVEACFNGHSMGVKEVCEMLPDADRSQVNDRLCRLEKTKRLIRVSNGVYKRIQTL